ncbi:DUF4239 domain-containing protein [Microvirga sp. 2MCAF38]|uniref:bestrophin-like domain n=1 Tax=Microvirga sp. 2MCAF38 TaxID=3232989 RepID=UPI003F97D414
MLFLTVWPLWISGAILIGAPTLLAMIALFFVRRRIPAERHRINNEVAGFTFATVGVLFAVLLAFAVIIVWQKFAEAETVAAQEAGAVATLYRLAHEIGGDPGAALHDSLTRYVHRTIEEDWPAMERSGSSLAVTRTLDNTYATLLTFSPNDGRGTALLSEALHQLDVLTQARRTRLVLASGAVPGVLWFVLFGGAFLTVAFTLFFGTENLLVQSMMTGMLSCLIFSGLLVIVAIEHPFAGSVKVQPDALHAVLRDLGAKAGP